jgi:hypothetical protein
MKRQVVVFLCFFSLSRLFAQQGEVITQAAEAIKAGSARELARFFPATIDITLEGKPGNYSKAQGELVLRDFFRAHPPAEFSLIHRGQSKGGQPFAIGQYKSGPDTYRVWLKMRVSGSQQFIEEISFVKQ